MQVTETLAEGLKRELKVIIEAKELHERVNERLQELKSQVRLKGFRPGKVPVEHIRKVYGRSVMADVLQQAISETSQRALEKRHERPAFQPHIDLPEDKDKVEQVMTGQADLEYTMSFEVLPEMTLTDLRTLKLEKPVAEVDEQDVEDSVNRLLESGATYEPVERAAEEGDRVTIDFVGKIDGEPFEGGSAEGVPVVIGKGGFIPGFEDGLKGAKAGEERVIEATFPEDYQAEALAGKTASFDVSVTEVAAAKMPEADDEFAKGMGFESLDKLKEAVRSRLADDLEQASRAKLKRALLDALDKEHDFALPEALVESEFQEIWKQVTHDLEHHQHKTFADLGKDEEAERARYRKIAERRVRLGLILSEIGRENKIEVSDEDLRHAVIERARQYPGQEKAVLEYYQKNPQAVAELRPPIFEDKVVAFAIELADVSERKVSKDELFEEEEDDEDV